MDHPIDLASAALSVLAPYLAKVRKYDAAKFGDGNPELGGKLLMWLRENLDSRGHEAIIELAAKPDSADNQSDLRKQLVKALEANPALFAELTRLLPHDASESGRMLMSAGVGAKVLQVKGWGNTIALGATERGDDGELVDAEYPVWYGTNRKPNDPANLQSGYSGERDTMVHLGVCRVFVPKSHKIGSIGSPWWKRLMKMTDDRLRLLSVEQQQDTAFWHGVSAQLKDLPLDDQCAVVFVHGYNVTFADAALRAAQIGFDLSIKGAMAFFSWP